MSLHVSELAAALPEDFERSLSPQEVWRDLLTRLSGKPVPVGVWQRLWGLGSLQAKIALAYLAYWVRSGFYDVDENTRRLNETHLNAALRLVEGMSYLRGAVMKVGQMLANYPNLVGDEFAEILSTLHFEAPPMHFSLLREQVRRELGADPEELFEEFETQAFAAASLGQVHRARLKSGRLVAVKIQYPSMGRAVRDDFRALSAFIAPMRLTRDWDSIREQGESIRRTVEAETDYEREAEHLRQARAAIGDDIGVVVPRVHEEYSTKRVLTMDYLDGRHVQDFLATNPPQALRDRQGAQIFQSSFRLWYRARLIYADPHPGNFLFLKDGRLGLIDFGCCHRFSDEEWELVCETERESRFDAWSPRLRPWMARSIGLTDEREVSEERMRMMQEYCAWLWEPFQDAAPFDFSDEPYFRRGVLLVGELVRRGYTAAKPVNMWMTRCFFGIRALVFRLKARVAARTILDAETTVRPPS